MLFHGAAVETPSRKHGDEGPLILHRCKRLAPTYGRYLRLKGRKALRNAGARRKRAPESGAKPAIKIAVILFALDAMVFYPRRKLLKELCIVGPPPKEVIRLFLDPRDVGKR